MIKKYILLLGVLFSTSMQADDTQNENLDEATRNFNFENESRAFSNPNNSANFASETLFSLSDFGRKTFHAYRSTAYKLTRIANYQPMPAAIDTNEVMSSPMIKVTGSAVIVDLNGFTVSRQDVDSDGAQTVNAVGIEIGYSPYDRYVGRFGVTADTNVHHFSSVVQPENVTIKNGTLNNFGIGIIIHPGVRNVTLENITITNSALGIVCAGQYGKQVVSVTFKNVSVVNDGTDRSSVLSWAREKLVNQDWTLGLMTYATLVPLQVDPITYSGASPDGLLPYCGVLLAHTNNASFENVNVNHLGYERAVDNGSDEEEVATATYGLYAMNSTNIVIDGADTSSNSSLRLVSGMYFNECSGVDLKNVKSTNNKILIRHSGRLTGMQSPFGLWASGISIIDSQNIVLDAVDVSHNQGVSFIGVDEITSGNGTTAMGLYTAGSVINMQLNNVQNKYTYATYGTAYSMYCGAVMEGLTITDTDFSNVQGGVNAYGIYFNYVVHTAHFENVQADNVVALDGVARGIYFGNNQTDENDVTTRYVTLKHVSCSNEVGTDRAEGIKFAEGDSAEGAVVRSVTIDGLVANNNRSSGTDSYARGLYFDESILLATDISVKNAQCSNHEAHHVVEGAEDPANDAIGIDFGCPVESLLLENIIANNQQADDDAYGIQFESGARVKSAVFKNIEVNNIYGNNITGGIYFGSTLNNGTMESVRVQGITGAGSDTYGLYLGGDVAVLNMHDCSVDGTSGATTGAGIRFQGTTKSLKIDGLTVRNASNTGLTDGIYFNGTFSDSQMNHVSVENVTSTEAGAAGMRFNTTVTNVAWDDLIIQNVTGKTTGHGFYSILTATNVEMKNVSVAGITGGSGLAAGLYFSGEANAGITFKNVVAKNNAVIGIVVEGTTVYSVDTCAYGIKMNSGNALTFDNVNCSYNVGTNATQSTNASTAGSWNTVSSVGMWLINPSAVEMKNVTCDYNTLGGTSAAAYTFGLLLDNPSGVSIDSVSCSHNKGNAHVSGVFVNGGSAISLKNVMCSGNVQQGTGGATVQTDVVTITPNGNLSKHTVLPDAGVDAIGWVTGEEDDDLFDAPESLKGAFGIFIQDAQDITLDTVNASKNNGFRAIGVELLGCAGVRMTDCVTSMQSADGDLFLNDADDSVVGLAANEIAGVFGASGCAVTLPALYLSADSVAITPDIFGIDFNPVIDVIDLQATTVQFLNNAKLLKDAPSSNIILNNVETMYSYHKPFVESVMLARGAIAKKRAWGVAVGTQAQNCSNVQIDNLIASGNTSAKDSAFGLLFANRCSDCKVHGGQFNSNTAWTDSAVVHTPGSASGTIDITAMNPFWGALDIDLPNSDGYGYVSYGYFDEELEEWVYTDGYGIVSTDDAINGRLLVRLNDDDTIKELCTPCGPIAAGIVIGDTSERVEISDVTCAGNQGNAGQSYGLMHDVSASSVVQNAKLFQNMTNLCGISYGLAEFNPQSSSVQLGNIAFGNQYYNFVDSNYMVPFNPVEPWNLEFPLKVGYNGNITDLANASPYDNVELRFIFNAPTDPTNLPNGVAEDWLASDLMVNITNDELAGVLTATSNVVDADPFVEVRFTGFAVDDPIGGWDVHITINETYTVNLNAANQHILLNSATDNISVSLRREGFEDITQDLLMTGTVTVNVNAVGIVTLVSAHFDVIGPDDIDFNIEPETMNVTNITARSITLALDTAITNSGTDQSTIVLEPTDGIATMTTIGGVDIVTSAFSFAASNVFDWDATTSRNISGTATMIGAGDTTLAGSGSVEIDQFGDVTSFTGTLTATVGGNLVATLTVTGFSNESYSGYNTSSRTAGITLNYAQDSNSTLINSPTLGALSSNIFAGYSLTGVSLTGSADPVYGTNEQGISISGTATLGDLGGVTISGTVYVDTDGNGIPNGGEGASTLTVVHAATGTTVATITISGFTFSGNFASLLASGVNSISGARVYVNTWDGGGSTIDAQVTGLANSGGGSLTLRGWTITFTSAFSSGVGNFPDNVGNGVIGASGVATISDGLGTFYTGVTISGTVYVYSDNVFAISDLASNHGGSASSASATVGGQSLGISIGNISIS